MRARGAVRRRAAGGAGARAACGPEGRAAQGQRAREPAPTLALDQGTNTAGISTQSLQALLYLLEYTPFKETEKSSVQDPIPEASRARSLRGVVLTASDDRLAAFQRAWRAAAPPGVPLDVVRGPRRTDAHNSSAFSLWCPLPRPFFCGSQALTSWLPPLEIYIAARIERH